MNMCRLEIYWSGEASALPPLPWAFILTVEMTSTTLDEASYVRVIVSRLPYQQLSLFAVVRFYQKNGQISSLQQGGGDPQPLSLISPLRSPRSAILCHSLNPITLPANSLASLSFPHPHRPCFHLLQICPLHFSTIQPPVQCGD